MKIKQIICKYCNKEYTAFSGGLNPNGKGYIYVDSYGKRFNGKVCPGCHKDYVNAAKKVKRAIKNEHTQ